MEQKLNSIRMAVGQGELQQAFDELTALLSADDRYDELLNALRINEGNFRETRSQVVKGTISVAEARQANNVAADNLLVIADMVERGELAFNQTVSGVAARKIRWQYFAIGGLVALAAAFFGWKFFLTEKQACPDWGASPGFNVMILPFKTLGETKGKVQPQVELLDMLDGFSSKSGLAARASINESYDIEKHYPSSSEAMALADGCSAQMVIWGKINQKTSDKYTIDVKYRLLDAGTTKAAGDTTISRLLTPDNEGGFSQDIESVSRFLFVVIANRLRRPDVALRFMEKISEAIPPVGSTAAKNSPAISLADTSLHSQMAYAFASGGQHKKAVDEYSKVLEADPKNWSAMQNRGLARYAARDFEGAAIDLEAAQSVSQKPASAEMLRIQTESNLQANRLEEAKLALDGYQQAKGGTADRWTVEQKSEYDRRVKQAEKERKSTELAANQKPADVRANLRAAKTNLKLGDSKKATQFADRTLAKQPKNLEAWTVKIEAAHHEGGDEGAQKVVEEAERKGVQARDIVNFKPIIAPLVTDKKKEQ